MFVRYHFKVDIATGLPHFLGSVFIGDNAPAVAVNLTLNIRNPEIKEYGQYQTDLTIDGTVQVLPLLYVHWLTE